MKRFLVTLTLALALAGCGGSGHKPKPPPAPPPVPVPAISSYIAYSAPNGWHLGDPVAFAGMLGGPPRGVNATQLDWTPYIQSPPVCNGSTNATYPEKAKAFVQAMRAKGIWTFIAIANFNGCATTGLPDSWFKAQVEWIAVNIGTDHVALMPVAEPWAFPGPKGLTWTRLARAAWPGKFVLPDRGANHRTGEPMWNGVGEYELLDVHYCSSSELVTALNSGDTHSLANTDCGTILNPGPARAAEWVKVAVEHKTHLFIYDFRAATPDASTVDAMKQAIKNTGTPVPSPTPVPPVAGAPGISEITFLDDPTVGSWKESSQVTGTSITNPHVVGSGQEGTVCINHTMASKWPVGGSNDGPVEGNPWVVAKVGGRWFAFTYEFNGVGTTCRSIAFGIWGRYAQYSAVSGWHPQPGELVGLFVSTLARPGVKQTSDERSDIRWLAWP